MENQENRVLPDNYFDADGRHVVTEAERAGMPNYHSVELQLEDKQIAFVWKGKGKHVQAAQKICGTNQEMYIPALMHLLVKINGAQLPVEDWGEMDMADYLKIQAEILGAGNS